MSSTPEIAPYTARQRAMIMLFSCLGTVLDGADFAIFLIFLAPIAAYFETTLVNVAIIQAISYLAGIVGGIVFGMVSDRKGRRLGLILTVGLFSLATLASAFAPSFGVLLVLRVVAGIGIGGESGIAFSYLMESSPGRSARRGGASGILQAMFIVGSILSTFTYVQTSAAFGTEAWRAAFVILGVLGLLALVLRLFTPESRVWQARHAESASGSTTGRVPFREAMRPLMTTRMLLAVLLMTFAFFGAYAVGTYGASMLQTVFTLEPATVGLVGYTTSAITLVAYLLGGYLADRLGRRRSFIVMASIGTVAYLAFGFLSLGAGNSLGSAVIWTSPVIIGYLFIYVGFGYFGAQGVWLSELFPTAIRSTAQNLAYYVGRGIGAGVLPLVALTIATGIGADVRLAIALGVIGTIGTIVFAALLPETKGIAIDEVGTPAALRASAEFSE
ncbi:MFS transporter [Microbacterium ulmi]|uniref:MFS transporter n=1 Tax=Microbacterium ulmi TaxID=179095 RepID=A0A7Y2Q188_9MICO|nr:MFS transporter [Microbacterium ulmi]NII68682.1 SHS family lactate transporter-like MFS transporter [Microbacterium ulmi]NNH03655.1 MFS transporter [Microbacterium ulmi]